MASPDFRWHSNEESDIYRSLTNLIKTNGGFFKSNSQAYFYRIEREETPEGRDGGEVIPAHIEEHLGKYFIYVHRDSPGRPGEDEFTRSVFGVENRSSLGQYTVVVEAEVQWAAGIWGRKRVGWAFVLDGEGVVRQYKLHTRHSRDESGKAVRGATGFDASRTELLWERSLVTVGKQPIVKVTHRQPYIQDYDDEGDYSPEPPKVETFTEAMRIMGFKEIHMAPWLAREKKCPAKVIVKIISRSAKAVEVEDIDGRQYWLPLSQIEIIGEE